MHQMALSLRALRWGPGFAGRAAPLHEVGGRGAGEKR